MPDTAVSAADVSHGTSAVFLWRLLGFAAHIGLNGMTGSGSDKISCFGVVSVPEANGRLTKMRDGDNLFGVNPSICFQDLDDRFIDCQFKDNFTRLPAEAV